jgi:hypothetical protein
VCVCVCVCVCVRACVCVCCIYMCVSIEQARERESTFEKRTPLTIRSPRMSLEVRGAPAPPPAPPPWCTLCERSSWRPPVMEFLFSVMQFFVADMEFSFRFPCKRSSWKPKP